MKYVTFNSPHLDSRTLSTADLESVGVEGFEETTFKNGVPVEVYVRVAKALVSNPSVFGYFTMSDELTEEEEAAEKAEAEAAAKAAEEAKALKGDEPSGNPQETLTPSTPSTSGKSTRSSTP